MTILKNKNIILSILLIAVMFLILITFFLEISSLERVLLPFFIFLFINLGICVLLNKICKDKFVAKIYLISLLLHLIFILFWNIFKYHLLGYCLPTENVFKPFTIDNDGALYHSYGVYISQHFMQKTLTTHFTGGLYPKIVGCMYHYFGINPFIVCLFNLNIGSLVAPIIYLIGKHVFREIEIAKLYSFLSILTFAHIMNTSIMIRDAYITLFMYLSIFLSFIFYKSKNIFYLILTLISLYTLYSFRPYASFVIFFAIVASLIVSKYNFQFKQGVVKSNIYSLVLTILSPIVICIILFLLYLVFSSLNLLSVEDLIEVREISYQYGDAQIAFDFGALYSKFFLLPFIIGYIYLFGAPFPWEWVKPSRIVYVPDMFFLYCFLSSFFKNIKFVLTSKNYLLLISLFSIIFMISIYCITLGNSGAIHRLRGPFIPMIYLIAMSKPDKFLSKILNKIQKWRIL